MQEEFIKDTEGEEFIAPQKGILYELLAQTPQKGTIPARLLVLKNHKKDQSFAGDYGRALAAVTQLAINYPQGELALKYSLQDTYGSLVTDRKGRRLKSFVPTENLPNFEDFPSVLGGFVTEEESRDGAVAFVGVSENSKGEMYYCFRRYNGEFPHQAASIDHDRFGDQIHVFPVVNRIAQVQIANQVAVLSGFFAKYDNK